MSYIPTPPRHRESYSDSPPAHRPSSSRRHSQSGTRRHSHTGRRSSGAGVEEPPYISHRSPPDYRAHRTSHYARHDSDSDPYRDPYTPHRRRRSSAGHPSTTRPAAESPRFAEPDTTIRHLPGTSSPAPMPSPGHVASDRNPMGEDITRKRSLIRPERRRHALEDADYHYRIHAENMNVMPSTTGRDPLLEDDLTLTSETATLKHDGSTQTGSPPQTEELERGMMEKPRGGNKRVPNKLTRKSARETREEDAVNRRRQQKIQQSSGTLSLWIVYCHIITFYAPGIVLRCFGKKARAQQRAWREKMGLVSIILLIMLFVGYLTFGFTQTVCPAGGPLRLRVNNVGNGSMIFHGRAYDFTRSKHPLARGIAAGGNVLYDMDQPHGGQDGSFLFQNVNGACKGLITPAQGSDVPTDSSGNLAWYFPCTTFNQDGSTKPNYTIPYYLGYACHTSHSSRKAFYGLDSSGEVFYTWNDIKNSSRNLLVYSGDVLDLDLLEWFNTSQIAYPSRFDDIRTNSALRGIDTTIAFTGSNKQIAQCFQEIIKVGSIDTESVGCIASKVVLYVSLIFILGIVIIKFVLALIFQWFLCRRFAAHKTSMTSDKKKRQQQIEEWTDDIYRPPPKMTDPASNFGSEKGNKRASFLPTTSRFTSPYAIDQTMGKTNRPPPTTMASQQSTSHLQRASTGAVYANANRSEMTLPTYSDGTGKQSLSESHDSYSQQPTSQRYSTVLHTDTTAETMSGPQGAIHEQLVAQPPPEWQPFGYPLAHAICLVTAYSEGPEGIRTTLDSIAMTDYPNSHKLLFVVCDGLIKGKGERMTTPEACISMMRDHTVLPEEVQAFSYVAVASGSKRHNMAKIYSGFYDYGADSIIPREKQQRVPMIVVVKCGTPAEVGRAKPGNRGKRDSQIVLMSFLQKVMFDERMTELEYEMFNGIWKITGISPDFYEVVLMVDADTKVFPDSLTHMVSAMVKDPEIMGLCGETKIANKTKSWVSMIQVFEYFISHHLSKSFESVFGGVTCLPGCFCMYRIKTPKGGQNYWVPILANPDIVEHYSENVVETLHQKNLLLLGEDRYLSTLMLRTFPKRKQVFVPQAVCKTTVPEKFSVLLSQRRRWINSTVHNLMELVMVKDLCGTFCFSMQFVVFIELVGTLVLPAAISFTIYLCALGIKAAITHTAAPLIPLILLALILGLPGLLIVITAHRISYVGWMLIYLLSLPVWNFVLPLYAYWHFDDFSWGDTRQTAGVKNKSDKFGEEGEGEFDSAQITMKRWGDFEQERRLRAPGWGIAGAAGMGYEKRQSGMGYHGAAECHDYP